MGQDKITSFFAKQTAGGKTINKKQLKQCNISDLKKVVRLPKASICADDQELLRLLNSLQTNTRTDELVFSLRQLACYTISIEQLERVPLGKRIKQLRQHADPDVQRLATRLVDKLRNDFAATTVRRRQKISGYTITVPAQQTGSKVAAAAVASGMTASKAPAAADDGSDATTDDD